MTPAEALLRHVLRQAKIRRTHEGAWLETTRDLIPLTDQELELLKGSGVSE